MSNAPYDNIEVLSPYLLYPSSLSHLPSTSGATQERIKRPMNPFMVWSSEKRKIIAKQNPKLHNSEISKQLGAEWKNLPQERKQLFIDKSNQLREEHRKKYPGYKYCPRKKTKPNFELAPELPPPSNYSTIHTMLSNQRDYSTGSTGFLNNNYLPNNPCPPVVISQMVQPYIYHQKIHTCPSPASCCFNTNIAQNVYAAVPYTWSGNPQDMSSCPESERSDTVVSRNTCIGSQRRPPLHGEEGHGSGLLHTREVEDNIEGQQSQKRPPLREEEGHGSGLFHTREVEDNIEGQQSQKRLPLRGEEGHDSGLLLQGSNLAEGDDGEDPEEGLWIR